MIISILFTINWRDHKGHIFILLLVMIFHVSNAIVNHMVLVKSSAKQLRNSLLFWAATNEKLVAGLGTALFSMRNRKKIQNGGRKYGSIYQLSQKRFRWFCRWKAAKLVFFDHRILIRCRFHHKFVRIYMKFPVFRLLLEREIEWNICPPLKTSGDTTQWLLSLKRTS